VDPRTPRQPGSPRERFVAFTGDKQGNPFVRAEPVPDAKPSPPDGPSIRPTFHGPVPRQTKSSAGKKMVPFGHHRWPRRFRFKIPCRRSGNKHAAAIRPKSFPQNSKSRPKPIFGHRLTSVITPCRRILTDGSAQGGTRMRDNRPGSKSARTSTNRAVCPLANGLRQRGKMNRFHRVRSRRMVRFDVRSSGSSAQW